MLLKFGSLAQLKVARPFHRPSKAMCPPGPINRTLREPQSSRAALHCDSKLPDQIVSPTSKEGETMSNYRVLINDNAHFMDESERADHGVFADADEAIAACKESVDDELKAMCRPGMTAKELYKLYTAFGPDPFVEALNPNDPDVEFSAWTYAKTRCKELVGSRH